MLELKNHVSTFLKSEYSLIPLRVLAVKTIDVNPSRRNNPKNTTLNSGQSESPTCVDYRHPTPTMMMSCLGYYCNETGLGLSTCVCFIKPFGPRVWAGDDPLPEPSV